MRQGGGGFSSAAFVFGSSLPEKLPNRNKFAGI
jgi:hypothetical protein